MRIDYTLVKGRRRPLVSTNTRNLSSILELSDLMLAEANHAEIVEKIMDTAADMCDADGWFFYNVNDDKFLTLSYSVNKSLKITRRGSDNYCLTCRLTL